MVRRAKGRKENPTQVYKLTRNKNKNKTVHGRLQRNHQKNLLQCAGLLTVNYAHGTRGGNYHILNALWRPQPISCNKGRSKGKERRACIVDNSILNSKSIDFLLELSKGRWRHLFFLPCKCHVVVTGLICRRLFRFSDELPDAAIDYSTSTYPSLKPRKLILCLSWSPGIENIPSHSRGDAS
jgi:hypothetical protein